MTLQDRFVVKKLGNNRLRKLFTLTRHSISWNGWIITQIYWYYVWITITFRKYYSFPNSRTPLRFHYQIPEYLYNTAATAKQKQSKFYLKINNENKRKETSRTDFELQVKVFDLDHLLVIKQKDFIRRNEKIANFGLFV